MPRKVLLISPLPGLHLDRDCNPTFRPRDQPGSILVRGAGEPLSRGKAVMTVVLWAAGVGNQDGWERKTAGCSHRTVHPGKSPIIVCKCSSSPSSRKQGAVSSSGLVKHQPSPIAWDTFSWKMKASWPSMPWETLLEYHAASTPRYIITL